ncbi:MAG TPA: PDZ domain-containing protein [Pirellulales bacterium]|jgi:membrane-associated protease RseP (regulator of RpoE activity)|nr:PDZ domain-containing protein [Pirellulales bacterium]
MKRLASLLSVGFFLAAFSAALAQQAPAHAQQTYVPPQTIGPPNAALNRQPEQEIVYLGHEQARLGVTLADDEKGHVWIRTIIAGSPADRAHLRPGDQIVAMNESTIHHYADAVRFINGRHPDEEITIAINRDGTPGGVTAVLGWARGMQSNTLTVPSGSIQFKVVKPGHTYNPEYVYPNKPGEYTQPWAYGHLGTGQNTGVPIRTGPPEPGVNTTEAIGNDVGGTVGRGAGQPGQPND